MTDQSDLTRYLDACRTAGSEPVPAVVKILTDAAKAPAETGFVPPTVYSRPERSTAEFLAEQNDLEHRRRAELEAQAYRDQPAFDREKFDAERQKNQGRAMIGNPGGSTNIDGTKR